MIDFNDKRNKKIIPIIIIVLFVLTMVVPTVAGVLMSAGIF